jgi:hypothetical protein
MAKPPSGTTLERRTLGWTMYSTVLLRGSEAAMGKTGIEMVSLVVL